MDTSSSSSTSSSDYPSREMYTSSSDTAVMISSWTDTDGKEHDLKVEKIPPFDATNTANHDVAVGSSIYPGDQLLWNERPGGPEKYREFWALNKLRRMDDPMVKGEDSQFAPERKEDDPESLASFMDKRSKGVKDIKDPDAPIYGDNKMENRVIHLARNMLVLGGTNLENLMYLLTNVQSDRMQFRTKKNKMTPEDEAYKKSRTVVKINKTLDTCFPDVIGCAHESHIEETKRLKWYQSAPLAERDPLFFQNDAKPKEINQYYVNYHSCVSPLKEQLVHPGGDLEDVDMKDVLGISFKRNGDLECEFLGTDDISLFTECLTKWRNSYRAMNESRKTEQEVYNKFRKENPGFSGNGNPNALPSIQRMQRNDWIKLLRVTCVATTRLRAYYILNSLMDKPTPSKFQSKEAIDDLIDKLQSTSIQEIPRDEFHLELEEFVAKVRSAFTEKLGVGARAPEVNIAPKTKEEEEKEESNRIKNQKDPNKPFVIDTPLIVCPFHADPYEKPRSVEDAGFLPRTSSDRPIIRLGHFIPNPHALHMYRRECMICLKDEAYVQLKQEAMEIENKTKLSNKILYEARKAKDEKLKAEVAALKKIEDEKQARIAGPSTKTGEFSLKARRNATPKGDLVKFKEEEEEKPEPEHHRDGYTWSGSPHGKFAMKSMYKLREHEITPEMRQNGTASDYRRVVTHYAPRWIAMDDPVAKKTIGHMTTRDPTTEIIRLIEPKVKWDDTEETTPDWQTGDAAMAEHTRFADRRMNEAESKEEDEMALD